MAKSPFIPTKMVAKATQDAEKPLIQDEFDANQEESHEESEENEEKFREAIAAARGEKSA